jgi:hypothetical protein
MGPKMGSKIKSTCCISDSDNSFHPVAACGADVREVSCIRAPIFILNIIFFSDFFAFNFIF